MTRTNSRAAMNARGADEVPGVRAIVESELHWQRTKLAICRTLILLVIAASTVALLA